MFSWCLSLLSSEQKDWASLPFLFLFKKEKKRKKNTLNKKPKSRRKITLQKSLESKHPSLLGSQLTAALFNSENSQSPHGSFPSQSTPLFQEVSFLIALLNNPHNITTQKCTKSLWKDTQTAKELPTRLSSKK